MRKTIYLISLALLVVALSGCSTKQNKHEACIQECKNVFNASSLKNKNKIFINNVKGTLSTNDDLIKQKESNYNSCINLCDNKYK